MMHKRNFNKKSIKSKLIIEENDNDLELNDNVEIEKSVELKDKKDSVKLSLLNNIKVIKDSKIEKNDFKEIQPIKIYKPENPNLNKILENYENSDLSESNDLYYLRKKRMNLDIKSNDQFELRLQPAYVPNLFSTIAIKPKKSENFANPSTYINNYNCDKSQLEKNDACKHEEIYTSKEDDIYTKYENEKKIQSQLKKIEETESDTKYYQGQSYYKKYLEKSDADIERSKITGTLGPMRINTNIKAINQIDYALGICKDFKNTGVCGYGDGCVFLHDRTEIKSSWEIEKDLKRKEQREKIVVNENVCIKKKEEKDKICPLCNKTFSNPIKTICNHIFCEKCAVTRYGTIDKNCFICKSHLKGVFNFVK